MPTARTVARETRKFLGRAVGFLAAEAGIRQFLDIGSGLPATDNVHEVAQRADPSCRVVYVDNDPSVLPHARALLTSTAQGRTGYFTGDLRDPKAILAHEVTRHVLDFSQPIALHARLRHPVPGGRRPARPDPRHLARRPAVGQLPGRHAHDRGARPGRLGSRQKAYSSAAIQGQLRDCGDFARLAFGDLEARGARRGPRQNGGPTTPARPSAAEVSCYGGVAPKP